MVHLDSSHSVSGERIPKILLLEDEDIARKNLSGLLQIEGYNVVAAANGEQAVEQIRTDKQDTYAALVMDIRMDESRLDGIDATEAIQQQLYRPIPAIMLSAYSSPEWGFQQMAEERELAIKGWVEKPLRSHESKKLMNFMESLFESTRTVTDELFNAFSTWSRSPRKALDIIEGLFERDASFDPVLVTSVLSELEAQCQEGIADFIAQVNFFTYKAQLASLLKTHEEGFIAYWKGKVVGHAATENNLIKAVYQAENTTDIFIAPLNEKRAEAPAGPLIVSRYSARP